MLPDATRLHTASPDLWRSLGRRLEAIGLAGEAAAPVLREAEQPAYARRAPVAKWKARRVRAPWSAAARMLVLGDPVAEDEARDALGDVPLEAMLDAGLLARGGGGLASPWALRVTGGAFFLSDDLGAGGDAVMGPSAAGATCSRAALPEGRARSALDVGCGAGAMAVALAARCDRVVATDASARALDVARVNAWMNGADNVDFRRGELFEPVAGEEFELVVGRPPSDAIALRVLREVPARLAPGGLALLCVDWPVVEGDAPTEQRLRAALDAPDAGLLVIGAVDEELDDHCEAYARLRHPELGPEWEELAVRCREDAERTGMTAVHHTLTVVRRSADGAAGWTFAKASAGLAQADFRREGLDGLLAACDLVARGPEAVRAARLRVGRAASFDGVGALGGVVFVRFPPGSIHAPITISTWTVGLLRRIEEAGAAGPAIDEAVREAPDAAAAQAGALRVVEGALLGGLLEIA